MLLTRLVRGRFRGAIAGELSEVFTVLKEATAMTAQRDAVL